MVHSSITVLEQVQIVSPLGMRFWDDVSGRYITNDLQVIASPQNKPWQSTIAITNRSGVYIFPKISGLEQPADDQSEATFWDDPSFKRSYLIKVEDGLQRFHPYSFSVELPQKGLLGIQDVHFPLSSPPPFSPLEPSAQFLPLFSNATRKIPSGMAVIRADLRNPNNSEPVPWAVLQVEVVDQNIRGIGVSNIKGSAIITFPYPDRPEASFNDLTSPLSPIDTNQTSLFEQSWELSLSVGWNPSFQGDFVPTMPDLSYLLQALEMHPARLWSNHEQQIELVNPTLKYGEELILRSNDQGNNQLPVLYLTQ